MDPQTDRTLIIEDASLRRGFTAFPNCVVMDKSLSVNARFLYGVLLSYAWQDGECFPGQGRLASDMGISVRTIQRILEELEAHKLISVEQRGLSLTNIYRVLTLPYSKPDTTPVSLQDMTPLSLPDTPPVADNVYSGLPHSENKEAVYVSPVYNKLRYGSLKNVLLTIVEYENLKGRFNGKADDMIEELSLGIASKGYKYKSHYAAILSWHRRDAKTAPPNAVTDPTKFLTGKYGALAQR